MRQFFATCARGLESVLEGELLGLSARELATSQGGIAFRGDLELGYRANLWLRSAIKVQELLAEGEVRSVEDLYRLAGQVPWEETIHRAQTLAVDATVRDSLIRHSGYAALTVKDAIVDRFRDREGQRPNVDTKQPDLPIKLVLLDGRAAIYRVLSGASLHKRGWRPIQVKSPLNESIAGGLLLLSNWDRKSPLVDPMCGSGTFVIEAANLALNRAPGRSRSFAFQQWVDFDVTLWESLLQEAHRGEETSLDFPLEGADRHGGSLELARRCARGAKISDFVRFTQANCEDFQPRRPPSAVFANPPYGIRLGEGEDPIGSWRSLGKFLHERCDRTTAWLISGDKDLTRHLGLRAQQRWRFMNGPVECRFLRYDVFDRRPPREDPAEP